MQLCGQTFGATSGRPDGHRKNCAFQTKKGKKFAPEKITETDAKHNEHALKYMLLVTYSKIEEMAISLQLQNWINGLSIKMEN